MWTWVPKDLFTDFFFKVYQLKGAISFKGSIHINQFIILMYRLMFIWLSADNSFAKGRFMFFWVDYFGNDGILSNLTWHHFSKEHGCGLKCSPFDNPTVFKLSYWWWYCYCDFWLRNCGQNVIIPCFDFGEVFDSLSYRSLTFQRWSEG